MTDNDDERYVLTPKSIFYFALKDAEYIDDIINETLQMKVAWLSFVEGMRKAGYLQDNES